MRICKAIARDLELRLENTGQGPREKNFRTQLQGSERVTKHSLSSSYAAQKPRMIFLSNNAF